MLQIVPGVPIAEDINAESKLHVHKAQYHVHVNFERLDAGVAKANSRGFQGAVQARRGPWRVGDSAR